MTLLLRRDDVDIRMLVVVGSVTAVTEGEDAESSSHFVYLLARYTYSLFYRNMSFVYCFESNNIVFFIDI